MFYGILFLMLDSFLHKTLRIPYRLNITKMRKSQNPKAVVIFIHGIASDAGMWQKAESEIEGELDIYAVDLIGHGESPKPKWAGAQQLGVQARAIRRMTFLMKKYKKVFECSRWNFSTFTTNLFSRRSARHNPGIYFEKRL